MLISTLFEAREHYTDTVEKGSRSGGFIYIKKPMLAYHATQQALGKVLTNREVKTYNSMGTWLSSNREAAINCFGPNSEAYHIPTGRYLIARRDQNMWEIILNCIPLIREALGDKIADHIEKYPYSEANRDFMFSLDREARDKDFSVSELLRWDKKRHKLIGKYRAIVQTQEYQRDICTSIEYNQGFRNLMDNAGVAGIIWNNRHWDTNEFRHTVFLIFHTEDLHPITHNGNTSQDSDQNRV